MIFNFLLASIFFIWPINHFYKLTACSFEEMIYISNSIVHEEKKKGGGGGRMTMRLDERNLEEKEKKKYFDNNGNFQWKIFNTFNSMAYSNFSSIQVFSGTQLVNQTGGQASHLTSESRKHVWSYWNFIQLEKLYRRRINFE